MSDIFNIFKIDTPLWIETEEAILINKKNLSLFLKEYLYVNKNHFNEFKDEEVKSCKDCNSENISFYQAPVNVPRMIMEESESKLLWVKILKCNNCGEIFISDEVLIAEEE